MSNNKKDATFHGKEDGNLNPQYEGLLHDSPEKAPGPDKYGWRPTDWIWLACFLVACGIATWVAATR